MKNDKETKLKLLESAKQEFMEKGYIKASLRNICKNAGVTTGALYFFFHGKEDLFASLVEEPIHELYEVMKSHYQEELKLSDSNISKQVDYSADLEACKQTIHCLYQYYDEFQLLLTKSEGSIYEKTVDRFVEITQKQLYLLVNKIKQNHKHIEVDDFSIHWIAHMNVEVFIHILTHDKEEQDALLHVETIVKFLVAGWSGLFEDL